MKTEVDFFVIGGGSGGVRAARIAAQHGASVAIAEEYRFGGTCVVRGCVPKKLFVYASRFHDAFEDARGFGWSVGDIAFDWKVLKQAKDTEIQRLTEVYERNMHRADVEVHKTRAVLEDANAVRLADGTVIKARHILIATGGRPHMLDIPGGEFAISSDDIFEMEALPARMTIIGGGYIAVEFAALLQRLGVKVTLVHRGPMLLAGFDEDLRIGVMATLQAAGVNLKMNDTVEEIQKSGQSFLTTFATGDQVETDLVLMATGRRPNTSQLGLEKLGVKMNAKGAIEVDAASRSSVPSIYAVGDVTDRANLTPVAIREGHAVADSLFGEMAWTVDHDLIATAVFSTPELGTVGMTEAAARAREIDIDVYRTLFRPMKHVLSGRDERTIMKLVVDKKTDRVLGVHILGEDAGEMIQTVAIAVTMRATKADFDRTMAVHPTAAEELVTLREKMHVPNPGSV
ncbi:glutathione-disulfide reductase [Agaricicola taiwanensis]|uniref:Glutathione-disulfide reductase n=1 Tax=Agaricicola taiwanensis TaxID=591372 RepID=A0A8J2VWN7_9RHOB|nr:glutathione-disulfide reductase [Agaricicola taiwanensis]GGE37521.1 glutathione-disulfide reductase [Agaricicola taiwanensis]